MRLTRKCKAVNAGRQNRVIVSTELHCHLHCICIVIHIVNLLSNGPQRDDGLNSSPEMPPFFGRMMSPANVWMAIGVPTAFWLPSGLFYCNEHGSVECLKDCRCKSCSFMETCKSLAAKQLRPTGGTTDFWPQSFHATPIGLMLRSRIQPGARCPSARPVPPPMRTNQ